MPRRRRQRQTMHAGKGGYWKQYGNLDTASRALAVAYAVKKLINVEYHSKKTDWTVDPNTTGTVLNLTAISQGDDFSNRQGRKIKLFSIRSMGSVRVNASSTRSHGRFMIVRDNLGSTTIPAIADMFVSVAQFLANQPKLDDPQTNARFTVLFDKFYILEQEQSIKKIDHYQKIGSHVTFTGTAGTDEGKGNIYVFSASNEATNDPIVAVSTVIKYIDN